MTKTFSMEQDQKQSQLHRSTATLLYVAATGFGTCTCTPFRMLIISVHILQSRLAMKDQLTTARMLCRLLAPPLLVPPSRWRRCRRWRVVFYATHFVQPTELLSCLQSRSVGL